ncbi:hypothetical protein B0H16DRAFT_245364 [Mycena metata]|uniref:CCHC-type domain-containing protein n=1 Tax=Mycena metata TaxID=1033252 RepID=A0AAD7HTQ1_9AGAR|nr:hypothetical protein B0H16DRAFT_245364 [Mycena metata]
MKTRPTTETLKRKATQMRAYISRQRTDYLSFSPVFPLLITIVDSAEGVPPPLIAGSSASPDSTSLDNLDDDIPPPIPKAEVIKEDEDTSDNGDVEEDGDADADLYLSATTTVAPPPIAGSSASPNSTSLDNWDDDIPPIPEAEVTKEDEDTSDDGDAEKGGDADANLYLSATAQGIPPPPIAGSSASPNSTSLDNWEDNIPSIPEAEVTTEDEATSDDEDVEEEGDADADLYLSTTAQAVPPPPIAGSSVPPDSSSPANASPSSSTDTLVHALPPNAGNVSQAVSALGRRTPSPVRQSPLSRTPGAGNVSQAVSALPRWTPSPVRQSPLSRTPGEGSQGGLPPDLRTGNKCYLCGKLGHWGNCSWSTQYI